MNSVTETKKIFLTPAGALICDSNFSDLKYNIPNLVSRTNNTLYNTIRILHAEIPYSFYLINEYNNRLSLSTGLITLTIGNYNANTFMEMLQPKLPTNMVISFNTANGVFTLTYTSSFSVNSSSTCNRLIGAKKNTTYNSTSNAIIFPHMANFLGTKNIYINTPNLVLDNFNTSTKTYTTLLCIQVTVSPYGVVFYDNKTSNKNTIKGVKDDSLEIQILDDDFNPINFNNTEWSITLEMETVKQMIFNNMTIN